MGGFGHGWRYPAQNGGRVGKEWFAYIRFSGGGGDILWKWRGWGQDWKNREYFDRIHWIRVIFAFSGDCGAEVEIFESTLSIRGKCVQMDSIFDYFLSCDDYRELTFYPQIFTFQILQCDPVLGDRGKFYVPQELVDIYKNEVLPLASF